MAISSDKIIDTFIGLIIFIAIVVAFVPMLLAWFTNLSGSGLVLATLFATILPIILAVMIFKAVYKQLKF